jgi:hypothetical protein
LRGLVVDGLRNGTIAQMEVGWMEQDGSCSHVHPFTLTDTRVSSGRTKYSNTHAASAPAACAAPACRPSRVCASAAWDDTRAMAIPVHVGGRARAKASAALLRCRCTSRRVGPRWPSCSSPIIEVGEECAVKARGSVRQDEGGAGDGKGEACASGRCRTPSGWRFGRVREGSRMKREGLRSVGATTQVR